MNKGGGVHSGGAGVANTSKAPNIFDYQAWAALNNPNV
jgi:hypothetical protein